jgi:hypothetical protein
MPSGGWTRRQRRMSERKPRRPRWSSWTKRSFAVYRARSPCTVPDRPWHWAIVPETVAYARRALDLAAEDDLFLAWSGSCASGSRILDERGSRGSPPVLCRWHGELAEGRQHLRRGRGRNDFG